MPATFDDATSLSAPYLTQIPLNQTNYKVNVDDPMGCQIRMTGDGMAVYMLYREPGVYLNDHGRKVPEVVAAQAGFDTAYWGKARRKLEAMRKAQKDIEVNFADISKVRVIAEHGEYRVIELDHNRCNLEFVDADEPPETRYTVLNQRGTLTTEDALRRFEELSGHKVSAPADASQPADADVEKAAGKRAK